MRPRLIITLLLLLFSIKSFAQKPGTVTGIIVDSASATRLPYSTISIVAQKDSTLIGFGRSDSSGFFSISPLKAGRYLLSISHVGFFPGWIPFSITTGQQLDMGKINLFSLTDSMAVTVFARRPPITINNDTIEFNAENFKTQPNAVVEDLLKRLPGITVEQDGTVKVNGQRINKIYVNGREFFTGDPKLATKNLDADAIDKVQVFDKKSDRAEFTGFDDGNTSKAINLKLKKDRDKAIFGRVAGGYGADDGRFDGQTNINRFKGLEQISLLAMANNTNRQGFSMNDIMNFSADVSGVSRSGGSTTVRFSSDDDLGLPVAGFGIAQQGIANTYAGGINYNNQWKKRTDLNTNFLVTDVDLNKLIHSKRTSFFPGNIQHYESDEISKTRSDQKRWNLSLDHKIDSFKSIKVTGQLSLQHSWINLQKNYLTNNGFNKLINDGSIKRAVNSNSDNEVIGILYRQRFRKKGRTISITFDASNNYSTQNGSLQTNTRFYNEGVFLKDSTANQQTSRKAQIQKWGGIVTYTEPLGKRSLLELSSYYNKNNGSRERLTFDADSATGKYDVYNSRLSNDFSSQYSYGGGILNFRTNLKRMVFSIGSSLQSTSLISINNSLQTTIQHKTIDLLPSFFMTYKFGQLKSLSFNLNTSVQQPSTEQLQPVADITDPVNVYVGNPALKRSYVRNFGFNYFSTNLFKQSSLFLFASASITNDAIVQADIINANGTKVSTPVNTNGVSYWYGSVNYSVMIRRLKVRAEFSFNGSYGTNASFINGSRNSANTASLLPSIKLSYAKEGLINVFATARVNFLSTSYSLSPAFNTRYTQHSYQLEVINYLPFGITTMNDFKYQLNSGRSDGFNTKIPYWTISIARSFMKYKRGEMKFSVQDLLNVNKGITRVANYNFIEDKQYNVLQRYFLLTFTYRIHKALSGGSGIKVGPIN